MSDKREPTRTEEDRKHPAGPHAKPELTNEDATPGTGSLPEANDERDADGATG